MKAGHSPKKRKKTKRKKSNNCSSDSEDTVTGSPKTRKTIGNQNELEVDKEMEELPQEEPKSENVNTNTITSGKENQNLKTVKHVTNSKKKEERKNDPILIYI